MSQIRFGGSVAVPHSQRVRAPRRRYSVARESSTERRSALRRRLVEPGDDVVDDAAPSGSLWVSWRRPGIGPPGHARQRRRAARSLRRARGGSASPWKTSVGSDSAPSAARTRRCSARASAPNRAVVACYVQRIREVRARRPRDRATAVAPSNAFLIAHRRRDAARTAREHPLPGRDRRVDRRGAEDEDVRQRPGRIGDDVAEGDQPAERVAVEDDRPTAGGLAGRPRAAPRGRRGSGSSDRRNARRPPEPPNPRWS